MTTTEQNFISFIILEIIDPRRDELNSGQMAIKLSLGINYYNTIKLEKETPANKQVSF